MRIPYICESFRRRWQIEEMLMDLSKYHGLNAIPASPLDRAVHHLLEDSLAENMQQGNFREGDLIHAEYRDEKVIPTKEVSMSEILEVVTAMQNQNQVKEAASLF